MLNTHPLYWHNNNSTVAKVNSINRIIEREREIRAIERSILSPLFLVSQLSYLWIVLVWRALNGRSHFEFITQSIPRRINVLTLLIPETRLYIPPDGIIFIVTRERFEYSQMDPFGSSVHLNIQWFVRLFVRAVLSLPSFPHCSNQIFLTARVRHKGLCHRSW